MSTIRPEIPPLPRAMQSLPVDKRGYPVPAFVDWINGEPDFRVMSGTHLLRSITDKVCWVCGQKLFDEMVFVVGPMCGINRISAEPPSHRQCAQFSAKACPFLMRPHMTRRDGDMPEGSGTAPGIAITRNPGVTLLWFTRKYEVLRVPRGIEGVGDGLLFEFGKAFQTEWYKQGRAATRAEALESIETGLPFLREANELQFVNDPAGKAAAEALIVQRQHELERWLPRE